MQASVESVVSGNHQVSSILKCRKRSQGMTYSAHHSHHLVVLFQVYIVDSMKLIGPLYPQELKELILLKYKQARIYIMSFIVFTYSSFYLSISVYHTQRGNHIFIVGSSCQQVSQKRYKVTLEEWVFSFLQGDKNRNINMRRKNPTQSESNWMVLSSTYEKLCMRAKWCED